MCFVQVAVDDDLSYLFNVAMMDARNITSVYAGTNVSFTSTDYQDCVADPDCTSQVHVLYYRNVGARDGSRNINDRCVVCRFTFCDL